MDLNTIETVNDLVEQNSEPTPPDTDRLDSLVDTLNLDLDDTYSLCLKLVQRLGTFHQSVIETLKEEGDCDRLVVWSQDEKLLETVWCLLNDVKNND